MAAEQGRTSQYAGFLNLAGLPQGRTASTGNARARSSRLVWRLLRTVLDTLLLLARFFIACQHSRSRPRQAVKRVAQGHQTIKGRMSVRWTGDSLQGWAKSVGKAAVGAHPYAASRWVGPWAPGKASPGSLSGAQSASKCLDLTNAAPGLDKTCGSTGCPALQLQVERVAALVLHISPPAHATQEARGRSTCRPGA